MVVGFCSQFPLAFAASTPQFTEDTPPLARLWSLVPELKTGQSGASSLQGEADLGVPPPYPRPPRRAFRVDGRRSSSMEITIGCDCCLWASSQHLSRPQQWAVSKPLFPMLVPVFLGPSPGSRCQVIPFHLPGVFLGSPSELSMAAAVAEK